VLVDSEGAFEFIPQKNLGRHPIVCKAGARTLSCLATLLPTSFGSAWWCAKVLSDSVETTGAPLLLWNSEIPENSGSERNRGDASTASCPFLTVLPSALLRFDMTEVLKKKLK
jgi:hypothetical protein